jgi:hypothetical protein
MNQVFRRSLTDLADAKVSLLDAAILILSPLAGLPPSRSAVALTVNFPNPGNDTSPPPARAGRDADHSALDFEYFTKFGVLL